MLVLWWEGFTKGMVLRMQPRKPKKKLQKELSDAVWKKDERLVTELVGRGANINVRFDNDFTLLHIAVREGDMRMMRLLVRLGADIHIPNARGNSPLELARVLDDIREINGKEPGLYKTLTEAYSLRHTRRLKAQHRLRGGPKA